MLEWPLGSSIQIQLPILVIEYWALDLGLCSSSSLSLVWDCSQLLLCISLFTFGLINFKMCKAIEGNLCLPTTGGYSSTSTSWPWWVRDVNNGGQWPAFVTIIKLWQFSVLSLFVLLHHCLVCCITVWSVVLFHCCTVALLHCSICSSLQCSVALFILALINVCSLVLALTHIHLLVPWSILVLWLPRLFPLLWVQLSKFDTWAVSIPHLFKYVSPVEMCVTMMMAALSISGWSLPLNVDSPSSFSQLLHLSHTLFCMAVKMHIVWYSMLYLAFEVKGSSWLVSYLSI